LVELTRYFDDYQQGIEYQASEIQGNTSWQQISDIITPKFIEKMTLENSRDNACQKEQHYVLNTDKQSISLIWLPAIKLVKKLIISSKTTEYSWQLQQLDSSVEKVKLPFKKWQQYKTTDYADVGDNEDDPFLAKMINLGFIEHAASGFYQADGQAIAAEHH